MELRAKLLTATALAGLLGAGSASAALQIEDAGVPSVTPQKTEANDVLGDGVTWEGFYGANASVDETTTLRFEFMGYEADYTNAFSVGANEFVTGSSAAGDYFDVEVGAGNIPFTFTVQPGTAEEVALSNGTNNPDVEGEETPNFFLSFENTTDLSNETTDNSLWVFLDDGGGQDDDNHDDMVVKITDVPEPGMIALLGAGLFGVGAASRRKRS